MDASLVAEGFSFAKDVATQLITLSTGLLTISITFTKDVFKGVPIKGRGLLIAAWLLHVVCITFGVWTLMALAGNLLQFNPKEIQQNLGSAQWPAMVQVIAFIAGTAAIALYGLRTLRAQQMQPPDDFRVLVLDVGQIEERLAMDQDEGWRAEQVLSADAGRFLVLLRRPPAPT